MIVRTFDSPFFFSNLFVPAKTGISELSVSAGVGEDVGTHPRDGGLVLGNGVVKAHS